LEKLRADYGGRKSRGVKPHHASKSGGSVIRKAIQQLETAGYIEMVKARGRRMTPAGRKLLKEVAEEVGTEMVKELPELQKYQKGE
jgi:small subunit ribosomal protein S19e